MIRIGIDVGGTNTDAVLMDGANVVAGVKAPTSADVMTGVVAALTKVLAAASRTADGVDVVMIGTTHFTNAVVQRRDLAPTAAVRLCLPATQSLPPMVDWPTDLRDVIGNHWYLAHGGNEFDGRVISALDEAELRGIAADITAQGRQFRRHHLGILARIHRFRTAGRGDFCRCPARCTYHFVQRYWPDRPAGTGKCGHYEWLSARPVAPCRRGVSRGFGGRRVQGAVFPDAE